MDPSRSFPAGKNMGYWKPCSPARSCISVGVSRACCHVVGPPPAFISGRRSYPENWDPLGFTWASPS